MGNSSGCRSKQHPIRYDFEEKDLAREPRVFSLEKRRHSQARSRGKSLERRRRGSRNRDYSPRRRKTNKSRSRSIPIAQQDVVVQLPQHPITRNVENPLRNSYDVQSRGGSTYIDPRSFSSTGSGLGELSKEVSDPYMRDLYYLTSTSLPTGRDPTNSGGRRTTTNHANVMMARGLSVDEDSYWGESKKEARSFGSRGAQQVQELYANPVRQKVYSGGSRQKVYSGGSHQANNYGDGWQQPQTRSYLLTPGLQNAYSGGRTQKSYSNSRTSNVQHSNNGYAREQSRYIEPREAPRSVDSSFVAQSNESARMQSRYIEPREAVRSRDSSFVTPSNGRQRRNAVKLETHDMPSGIYKGDRRYIQYGSGLWETVTVEAWNHWNGTWQVTGTNGRTMQAAPLSLKTNEEYRFLSKERAIGHRSFGSSF